jgi:hypothetical protein
VHVRSPRSHGHGSMHASIGGGDICLTHGSQLSASIENNATSTSATSGLQANVITPSRYGSPKRPTSTPDPHSIPVNSLPSLILLPRASNPQSSAMGQQILREGLPAHPAATSNQHPSRAPMVPWLGQEGFITEAESG